MVSVEKENGKKSVGQCGQNTESQLTMRLVSEDDPSDSNVSLTPFCYA